LLFGPLPGPWIDFKNESLNLNKKIGQKDKIHISWSRFCGQCPIRWAIGMESDLKDQIKK